MTLIKLECSYSKPFEIFIDNRSPHVILCRYAIGVMAFEILAGSYLHPYLGEKELRVVEGCPVGSVKFKAGALMYGAPRVMDVAQGGKGELPGGTGGSGGEAAVPTHLLH